MVSERLLHSRSKYLLPLLLLLLAMGAGFLFARSYFMPAVALTVSGVLIGAMILDLYEGTNKAATLLINALRNNDTTLQFPERVRNKSLAHFYDSLNRLNKHFQAIKVEHEYHEKYYRALIQHSATGLLVLNNNNQVELINKTACQYAGISAESTHPDLLRIKNPLFYEAICKLKPGEDSLYRHIQGNDLQILSFRATLLRNREITLKLISIQDIRYELETKELESYRKLISVLTHEIMNLMSPLTSVSKVLYSLYYRNNEPISLADMDERVLRITLNSLQVVDEQSRGIMSFVENYRRISRIPKPEIHPFPVEEWIEQLRIVYHAKMAQQGIDFEIGKEPGITFILADKRLLNQVMINLLNNAVEALEEHIGEKMIRIDIMAAALNHVRIRVANNGPAITPEIREKMFVPFFTTKKNGSGIGLSICQEIMKLHRGSLSVTHTSEGYTAFMLEI